MFEKSSKADIYEVVEMLAFFSDFASIKTEPLPDRAVLRHWEGDILYGLEEVYLPGEGFVPFDTQISHFCPGDGEGRILLYSTGNLHAYPEKSIEDGIEDLIEYLKGNTQEELIT